MGAQLGYRGSRQQIVAINVTPFVDVVLVLLIIFMVTAPLVMKEVLPVNLPKAASGDSAAAQDSIGVAITQEGNLVVGGVAMDWDALRAEMLMVASKNPQTTIIIGADTKTEHGNVVRAIDIVKGAGLSKFALQIQKQ